MTRNELGNAGLSAFIVLFVVAGLLTFVAGPDRVPLMSSVLGFAAPGAWITSRLASWIVNMLCIGGATLFISILNKSFNYIRSTDTVYVSAFLMLMASMPWVTLNFNSSTLMLIANLVCLAVLFPTYRRQNATQETFVVATILSAGAFFQYAFVLIIPAYLLAMAILNIFRLKETLAFLMGLLAPWWCMAAYMFLSHGPEALNMLQWPSFTTLFRSVADKGEMLAFFINLGFTAFVATVLAMNSSVKLFAGNKQVQAYNNIILFLGINCMVGMLADYSNILTYVATFYFCAATQIATSCALKIVRHTAIVMTVLATVYVVLFIFLL